LLDNGTQCASSAVLASAPPAIDMATAWCDPRVGDSLSRIERAVGEMAGADVQLSTNMRPRSEKGYILFQVTCTFRFPIGHN